MLGPLGNTRLLGLLRGSDRAAGVLGSDTDTEEETVEYGIKMENFGMIANGAYRQALSIASIPPRLW